MEERLRELKFDTTVKNSITSHNNISFICIGDDISGTTHAGKGIQVRKVDVEFEDSNGNKKTIKIRYR